MGGGLVSFANFIQELGDYSLRKGEGLENLTCYESCASLCIDLGCALFNSGHFHSINLWMSMSTRTTSLLLGSQWIWEQSNRR